MNTTTHRPIILLSNDDGVEAKGIHELIRMIRPLGDIWVMAPDSARSGSAAALSISGVVRYQAVHQEPGLHIFKCTGTPVDCIKLAIPTVLGGRQPDLVIGGINHGDNSAVNVHYSGTMGVVLEGCMKGIPSIGFSLCDHEADADFAPLAPSVVAITQQVLQQGLPDGVCLNVNYPLAPTFQGVRICRQTRGRWLQEWVEAPEEAQSAFRLTGNFVESEDDPTTDKWALRHGYVAITPVQVDMTAYSLMPTLQTWQIPC